MIFLHLKIHRLLFISITMFMAKFVLDIVDLHVVLVIGTEQPDIRLFNMQQLLQLQKPFLEWAILLELLQDQFFLSPS